MNLRLFLRGTLSIYGKNKRRSQKPSYRLAFWSTVFLETSPSQSFLKWRHQISMKKILFLYIFLASSPASAGGTHFPIRVTEMSSEGVNFKMTATVLRDEGEWLDNGCPQIYVSGTYDRAKWSTYKRPMSENAHIQAISLLNESLELQKAVYFGSFGNGLRKVAHCSYKSKAIFIENGRIYSIYSSI